MNIKMLKAAVAGLVLSVSGFANAGLITIDSYDIQNTYLSGTGGWGHTYNGVITLDGSTYDYTGGSGTLNDGAIGGSESDTHLFHTPNQSLITLFFNNSYTVSSMNLYSFANGGNLIPGNINDIFIQSNNGLVNLFSVGFGGPSSGNTNAHESFDFTNTALSGLAFNNLTFSVNTSSLSSYNSAYSISEIEINGDIVNTPPVNSVPEPTTLAIFALGIMGLASRRFKKQS